MIEVTNLTKTYGPTVAVDDVSFQVKEGDILGFLGANGAGKSTTMNIVAGYLSMTKGKVSVCGYDILEDPLRAKACIGYLPEHPPLYLNMSVERYLGFVFDLKKVSFPRCEHILEVCERVKITDMLKRVIGNLSKGYRQRLGLAQALLGYPPVLILDEPTVGIDPMQMIDIRNLVKELGRSHTVIFSSHILSEVQSICNRVLVIHKGRIVADDVPEALAKTLSSKRGQNVRICGPSEEVRKALLEIPGMERVTLLGSNEEDTWDFMIEAAPGVDIRKDIFFCLSRNGWPLILPLGETSLEDVFMNLVDLRGGGMPNTTDVSGGSA